MYVECTYTTTLQLKTRNENGDRSRRKSLHGKQLSRDGGIRTRDPLNPIQVRYRTALRPVATLNPPAADRTRNLNRFTLRYNGNSGFSGLAPRTFASCANSHSFRSTPPPKPVSEPSAPITR